MNATSQTCAIVGANGLVGRALVARAIESARYATVRVLVRRPLENAPLGIETHLVDFNALEASAKLLAVTHVFCCLGTTIKAAGSEAAFRRVDFDYALATAKLALEEGARQFVIVTAVGADSKSGLLYNRVKGELEEALRNLHFSEGVTVLHPSLLLGNRAESRPGEAIAAVFMRATRPLFCGPLERYRAIDVDEVARAMLTATETPGGGFRVLEGAALFALAR